MRSCFGCRWRHRPSVVQPEGPHVHAPYNKMLTSRHHSVGVGLQTEVTPHKISIRYFCNFHKYIKRLTRPDSAGNIYMHSSSGCSRRAARFVIYMGKRKRHTRIDQHQNASIPTLRHRVGAQGWQCYSPPSRRDDKGCLYAVKVYNGNTRLSIEAFVHWGVSTTAAILVRSIVFTVAMPPHGGKYSMRLAE